MLWIILAVNAILFVAGFAVGAAALSTALLADSLDRFGDAVVYAFTLWVLHHGCVWRVKASLSKAVVQTVFGLAVLGQAIWKLSSKLCSPRRRRPGRSIEEPMTGCGRRCGYRRSVPANRSNRYQRVPTRACEPT